jgi:arginine/ornithine transport system permease protein
MDFSIIFQPDNLKLYWDGLVNSLLLLAASLVVGGVLAVPLAVARVSSNRFISGPVWVFTYVMRGTPLLIQVYIIYYGLGQMEFIQARWNDIWPWTWFKEPMFCAILAFALNTCAYTAELLAGAIRDTGHGEVEAAQAMGMTRWTTMRRIVLPSAMRRSLPGYSNEVIMMLHSTSLASAVPALLDITGAARQIYADFYIPFEAFITAGVIYASLTLMLVGVFKLAERRWLAHLAPRKA